LAHILRSHLVVARRALAQTATANLVEGSNANRNVELGKPRFRNWEPDIFKLGVKTLVVRNMNLAIPRGLMELLEEECGASVYQQQHNPDNHKDITYYIQGPTWEVVQECRKRIQAVFATSTMVDCGSRVTKHTLISLANRLGVHYLRHLGKVHAFGLEEEAVKKFKEEVEAFIKDTSVVDLGPRAMRVRRRFEAYQENLHRDYHVDIWLDEKNLYIHSKTRRLRWQAEERLKVLLERSLRTVDVGKKKKTLIGRNGEGLFRLRKQSGAHVDFSEEHDHFLVNGEMSQMILAEKLIKDEMAKIQVFEVEEDLLGPVIGWKGSNIHRIREDTGVIINNERGVFIVSGGEEEGRMRALDMLAKSVKTKITVEAPSTPLACAALQVLRRYCGRPWASVSGSREHTQIDERLKGVDSHRTSSSLIVYLQDKDQEATVRQLLREIFEWTEVVDVGRFRPQIVGPESERIREIEREFNVIAFSFSPEQFHIWGRPSDVSEAKGAIENFIETRLEITINMAQWAVLCHDQAGFLKHSTDLGFCCVAMNGTLTVLCNKARQREFFQDLFQPWFECEYKASAIHIPGLLHLVVGPQGSTINELREKTKAMLCTLKEDQDHIFLYGTAETVSHATKLVKEIVDNCRRLDIMGAATFFIGKGGARIRQKEQEFGVKIAINHADELVIYSTDQDAVDACERDVKEQLRKIRTVDAGLKHSAVLTEKSIIEIAKATKCDISSGTHNYANHYMIRGSTEEDAQLAKATIEDILAASDIVELPGEKDLLKLKGPKQCRLSRIQSVSQATVYFAGDNHRKLVIGGTEGQKLRAHRLVKTVLQGLDEIKGLDEDWEPIVIESDS